ncbi:hypothetical protein NPIL_436191 [Nephila pilipes]|uniref:Uncharacterized protein n=1 Tax=Nephila pilipes TaxID=299642 RepID=A0A8X6TJD6_NEPPI|nr:hypothetical protein NPIL_436191 [Nephila pilipes]
MSQHCRRPPHWTILVAQTSDRCKVSALPSASIVASVIHSTYPPTRSPDLTCIDYFFWGYLIAPDPITVTKFVLIMLRTLLLPSLQLMWKSRTCPVFWLMFNLQ